MRCNLLRCCDGSIFSLSSSGSSLRFKLMETSLLVRLKQVSRLMDVILFDPLFNAPPNDVELFWLLEFDRFEMDRSNRRGGENSARLDFSMRREMSPPLDEQAAPAAFWLGTSSCVGLKKRARLDVSRVAVPNFGAACSKASGLFALFFNDDGVLRPKHFFGND